jgi:hypothetical protein
MSTASEILGYGGHPRTMNHGASEEAINLLTRVAVREAYQYVDHVRWMQLGNVLQLQARRIIAGTY